MRNKLGFVGIASLVVLAAAIVLVSQQSEVRAHCQVPCGIYDDSARVTHMKEDATTIAKAIANINELAGKNDANSFNQAARWVVTKEAHASNIIETVSTYFLTQKVKVVAPGSEGYQEYLTSLADHHAVMVAAMKTKQSAAPKTVEVLSKAIEKLAGHYEHHH